MKKILTLLIITVMITASFVGCGKDNTTAEEAMTAEITSIYDELMLELPDTANVASQKDYLIRWAGERKIPVSFDKNGNVIMSKKAVEGYENTDDTILQCSIGIGLPEEQYQAMATALYVIDKIEAHGFIRVLFTAATEDGWTGAETISTNYLRSENLINLTFGEKTHITLGSAGSAEYDFSKELDWITPTYPNAYEISIKGLNGGSSGITSGNHPNPIKIIGDFLASAKSKGVLIELASFNGGDYASNYPSDATAVVLINDSDVAKFEKWFNNDSSKFLDKFNDLEPNASYTLTPVEAPASVISKEDSTNIFSLMYTMINGIYLKSDDGEIIATSNIGTIRTTTGNLDVTICARSLTEATLNEMSSTLQVICGLNDISYSTTSSQPIWAENEESLLYLRFNDIFLDDFNKKIGQKTTMHNTDCAVFKSRNPNLDVLSMSINFENGITEVEALQHFLESLNTPWEAPNAVSN